MRLQSASPRRKAKTTRPRNSSKLSRPERHCQPAEITGFPPDFNSAGSFDSVLIQFKKKEARFRDASENALPLEIAENPAQAEAEDSSKIKDRLEALLIAETLQETLSPNADPGKWVNWRLSVLDA